MKEPSAEEFPGGLQTTAGVTLGGAAATSGAWAEIPFLKEQQWRTELVTAGSPRELYANQFAAPGGQVILT